MSEGILVFCELADGAFKKTAYELLGKASELSAQVGGSISAVVLSPEGGDFASLGKYGAVNVYHASVDTNNAGEATRAIQKAIEESGAKVVLSSASSQAKEIFPRLSARLKAGLGAEVTELSFADGQVVGKRPQFAGKVFSEVRILSEKQLFTVRGGSFAAPVAGSGSANVQSLDVSFENVDSATKLVEVIQSEATVVDLTEADRIVSGGRSVKSKENYDSLIRTLAASLGATAGASRAAVDAGYAGHSEQVGQTGKVVNPTLYIACGISGAIQHLAGMRTSRVIVSINKDKEAPIFKHSTYGIVADMFDVIPVLTQALSGGDIPVLTQALSGGDIPVVNMAKKTESAPVSTSAPKVEEAEVKKPATKKLSLKEKLAANKARATSAGLSSAPASKPVQTQKESTPVVPLVQAGAGIDPALVKELKEAIASLKTEVAEIKSAVAKSIKEENAALKKEIQRSEGNAKSFQDNAIKKIESVDKVVTNEVRRIREKTREVISNDTGRIQDAVFGLKGHVSAGLVINILTLVLAFIVLMKIW